MPLPFADVGESEDDVFENRRVDVPPGRALDPPGTLESLCDLSLIPLYARCPAPTDRRVSTAGECAFALWLFDDAPWFVELGFDCVAVATGGGGLMDSFLITEGSVQRFDWDGLCLSEAK